MHRVSCRQQGHILDLNLLIGGTIQSALTRKGVHNPPNPPLPRTQCLNPSTFSVPPLDGSLTLPEIHDWHFHNSPDHPLFQFPEDDGSVRTISWAEAVRAIHRAGRILQKDIRYDGNKIPIVGILASADYITYYTVLMGVIRLGYAVFFISPRNSAAAVTHLLSKTGTNHLLIGPEQSMTDLAEESIRSLQESGFPPPALSTIPDFDTLYPAKIEFDFEFLPPVKFDMDAPACLTHSSGSTAFPKPLEFTHYRFLVQCLAPWFGEVDKIGLRFSTHSIPMFHGMGMSVIAWAASCGLTITNFKPRSPSTPISAGSVIQAATATNSDVLFCVPMFVEEWARDPEVLNWLRGTKGIASKLFGGGPMSPQAGNILTDNGVPVYTTYGIGECGGIMTPLFPKFSARDWASFEFTPNIKPHFVHDEETGNSHVYIVANPYHVPNVLDTIIDGKPAYNTKDWLTPHPTKPGYWRIVDRVDNQIIHSTGEKTNPGPLEIILSHDPHVQAAIMFGRGKFNAGVLVEPHAQYAFDPSDSEKLAAFRNTIWPSVEKMNEYAPQHSRIFKEMILVASPSKPFEFTAKLSMKRQTILGKYEEEIEALYARVDATTQAELAPPSSWDEDSTLAFVRTVVNKVLKKPAGDSVDIFHQGCDSLQATWIRNSLIHALKETSKADVRSISSSFVYQHPTILALSSALSSLASSASSALPTPLTSDAKVSEMLAMVEKYSSSFPTHTPASGSTAPAKHTVLLTGSTGGLGASLLAKLVGSPDVVKVYAVNRESRDGKKTLVERQREVLNERGYDVGIVESPKVVFVEADLGKSEIGNVFTEGMFEEIRSSVTHVIHNAYRVDWNLSLTSFEPHIRALKNLISLSLSSPCPTPPTLLFTSSIGVLRTPAAYPEGPIKETPVPPTSALENGYAQSKWVCERLLEVASSRTPLRSIVVRVGQITGSPSGAWNTGEWFPSLVKSSVQLGALPDSDKDVSWIPADTAADHLVTFALTSAPSESNHTTLHLTHPYPTSLRTLLAPLSNTLSLPLIPFAEWVARLEASKPGEGRENPALALLPFYQNAAREEKREAFEAFGVVRMDTSRARGLIGQAETKRLGEEDVLSWVEYWRRIGFIPV
ncbi:acetyl-CoA synthetase-like protein [Cristinia sonorae]|uniref:Acetyl-CoA synthetase-like protein n=1 Tax=Cristinia sonorae TaxID=1940300 RepID=A0A8K0UER0_9AGAR|nr:acetyl-CoA synthetase-like protein [Cristinia sonorae]